MAGTGEGAYFDKVEMLILNDPNARQTALVTGDVNCVSLIELKTLALLERNPDIKVDNIPSGGAITMPMHCDTAPFDDVNVRNALKLAMNRDEIIEKISFGAATKGNDFHLSPVQPYWPDDIPQREYDPDQAKSLLKKAGQEGLSVNMSVADSVYTGRGGHVRPLCRTGQGGGHQHQRRARAERWLLFRRLAEKAVLGACAGARVRRRT